MACRRGPVPERDRLVFLRFPGASGDSRSRRVDHFSQPDGSGEWNPGIAEGLEVREGRVDAGFPGMPKIAFDWDLTSEALDFSGEEWLSGKPVKIELDNIRIGEGEAMAMLGRVEASIRVRSDLSGFGSRP